MVIKKMIKAYLYGSLGVQRNYVLHMARNHSFISREKYTFFIFVNMIIRPGRFISRNGRHSYKRLFVSNMQPLQNPFLPVKIRLAT